MRLLFITRKIDRTDALAGFSYQWAAKIAQQVDQLSVICLEQGDSAGLPENCRVYSLGKESGKNRWREFWLFQKYASQIVPQVDGIWSHQNPEYSILIAPWAKWHHKKLLSWYAHGKVNWKVRLMSWLTDGVMTSSAQGFRLPTKKTIILQQGIDTDLFAYKPKLSDSEFVIMSIGRITPSKRLEWSIDMVRDLTKAGFNRVKLLIIGEASRTGDDIYLDRLHQQIKDNNLESLVDIRSAVANKDLPQIYPQADLLLNCSQTGSLDKVVLEAMSCGTVVLTTNTAYKYFFKYIGLNLFAADYQALLAKARSVISLSAEERQSIQKNLRSLIVDNHNLDTMIRRIVKQFSL